MRKTVKDRQRAEDALRQEVSDLFKIMADAQKDPELRQEVLEMERTMAEVLKDDGRREGKAQAAIQTRQRILVRLLRKRFGRIPTDVVRTVQSTTGVDQLDDWLDGLVTANTLKELEIK